MQLEERYIPKITNFNVNWKAIKNACRTTIGKDKSEIEPNSEWKRKLLICRHSPIRKGIISWKWEEIPYAVSTHFARHHIGVEKWISTSRSDRTGIPREERSQMDYVSMEMEANLEALMNISERRLCTCASEETRKYWMGVLQAIRGYDEDIYWSNVPQCIRCGSCIECFSKCRFYENFKENIINEAKTNIVKRYTSYNNYRR